MRKILFGTALSVALLGSGRVAFAYVTGADPGLSGAPGDGTCIQCHGTTLNSGGGSVTLSFAGGNKYTPGATQLVTVTIMDPTAKRWGFEASPRVSSAASNTGAGTMAKVDSFTQIAGTEGTIQWITHTLAGTRNGTTAGVTFMFNWTAPATDIGQVDFYVTANAANGNNIPDAGDHVYTSKASLTAAPVVTNRPMITSVVNGASFGNTIEEGSWVTIFGSSLAPSTIAAGRTWNPATEIMNGILPTMLDGVSVSINGKEAAISYLSNTQLNVQAPDDMSTGNVAVTVTNVNGVSDTAMANLQTYSPGLFMVTTKYPAAILADGTYVGPSGLLGATVTSRPAVTGDVIQFFGTGFGPTNPGVPADQVYSGAAATVGAVTATIGGVNAVVEFAGVSAAGLYQINVAVPAGLASGDQPLVMMTGGVSTQSGLFVTMK